MDERYIFSQEEEDIILSTLFRDTLNNYNIYSVDYDKSKMINIPSKIIESYKYLKNEIRIAKYQKLMKKFEKKMDKLIADRPKKSLQEGMSDIIDNVVDKVSSRFIKFKDSVIQKASTGKSSIINVKNNMVDRIKESTNIDVKLEGLVSSVKIAVLEKQKLAVETLNEYKEKFEEFKEKQEENMLSIKEGVILKASNAASRLGRAKSDAVSYVINKTNNLDLKVKNVASDVEIAALKGIYNTVTKVNSAKCKVGTYFNDKVDEFKRKRNEYMAERLQKQEDKARVNQRKGDMKAALREQERSEYIRANEIKQAQIGALKEAISAVNSDNYIGNSVIASASFSK